jgi:hypothetical protein
VSRTGMVVSRPGRHCSGGGGGVGTRYDICLLDQAVPGGRRWWALFLLTN